MTYVSLTPIQHFISKHGTDAIIEMTEMLNAGLPHKQISAHFKMSCSQFSEFHRHIYKTPVYVLKDEIGEYLSIVDAERKRRWSEAVGDGAAPGKVLSLTGTSAPKDR